MKRLLALICVGLLSGCAASCSNASKDRHSSHTTTGSSATTSVAASSTKPPHVQTTADADKDNDVEAPSDDKNHNELLRSSGPEASGSERKAIVALIERYYAAAYAGDGAKGCSMIYSTLAESVPEDYGQSPPGPAYMKGSTCTESLTKAFNALHPLLSLEVPKLRVTHVRVMERHGIAILHFGTLPERQIGFKREGRTWKMAQLLDNVLE